MKNLQVTKSNFISFDVFDTLVIRNVVKPTDVFEMVGGRFFRCARIAAEILSRKSSKKEDITLDEIYRFLPKKLKQKELDTELAVCKPNPRVYQLYEELKSQGKKIFAVSDMYLPKSVIEKILINCGYELDGVYVSSEYGLSKTTGNLFKLFLEENNLSPDDVVHIGDNEYSDIKCAERVGINTLHIQKHKNCLTYLNNNKDLFLKGFVNHRLNSIDDRCEQIGYEMLGPIIVSFCQWIHTQKDLFGFDRLFFLSRDMHIIYDVYRKMYGDDGIDYLLISRKALHNALEGSAGLCAYLKKMHCYGNVAVVDTGWRCVAQPIIEHYAKINEPDTDIGGLYFGTKTGFNYIPRSKNSKSCFYSTKLDLIKSQTYSSFIESCLGYPENKVINFSIDGEPVFNNESKKILEIQSIQKGAFAFVNDWLFETDNRSINQTQVIQAYKNIQDNPLMSDVDLIGNCEYDDIKTTRLVSYDVSIFRNPKKWLINIRFSVWKGAYFKKSFKLYKPFYLAYLFFDSIYMSLSDIKTFKGKSIDYLLNYYK